MDRKKKSDILKRSAVFIDLDLIEYKKALELQMSTLKATINKTIVEDTLFFVEHPSVYTLGKRGGQENLSVSKEFLNLKNIEIVQTDRGGNITYHGPGQAVMYPIVHIEKNKIGVKDFVYGLEEIMRRTIMDFGINANRNKKNHGIWVKNSKIGSVGISIKKGVAYHGIALNIYTDLEPFSWINPCGLPDVSITSIKKELEKHTHINNIQISMEQIKKAFIMYFSSVFDYSVKMGNKELLNT